MSRYRIALDGEWFELGARHKLACCDCGLVHQLVMRVRAGRLEVAFTRDNRATAQRRRWKWQHNKTLAKRFQSLLFSNQEDFPLAAIKKAPKAKRPAARKARKTAATKRTATTRRAAKPKAKKARSRPRG